MSYQEFLLHLPLFQGLPEADLEWLSEHAQLVKMDAGEFLMKEGDRGDSAYIVMDGEFEIIKKSNQNDIVIALRETGAVIGEMALIDHAPRTASVRATCPATLLQVSEQNFLELIAHSGKAAISILHTVSNRLRQNEAMLRHNDKMVALGTLSAGLAHELNNPAAAARRSADQLQKAFFSMQELILDIQKLGLEQAELDRFWEAIKPPDRQVETEPTALLEQVDRQTEVEEWLAANGVDEGWNLAVSLAGAGWDAARLTKFSTMLTKAQVIALVKGLAEGIQVNTLLNDVLLSTERISSIIQSVKEYSYLDQAPVQEVDIHTGLENTLVILNHKLKKGVKVIRSYAPDLPHIEAHGSELNQVWTNLIDNAVDALQGKGEIILRTFERDGRVIIEIQDNGPGIPANIQERIFEPFFTTKPPGSGTGLGLHISYTIIRNHHGTISLTSQPGKTCFQVELPVRMER